MQQDVVRVGLLGLGPIGLEVARRVMLRGGLSLVAAADQAPQLRGRKLCELGPSLPALDIDASLEALIARRPQSVIMCTGSRIEALAADLRTLLLAGIDVVTSAEELAFPQVTHPLLAAELDAAARSSGAHALGTGVNPGFVLDLLPIILAQVSQRVQRVVARRLVDSNARRAGLRAKTGCGLTEAEFEARVARGALGHIGLDASAHLVAAGLGAPLVELSERIEPVIAERPTATPEGSIAAGRVLGIRQFASGRSADGFELSLELTIAAATPDPHDRIELVGDPSLELRIQGGLAGDAATAARLVNAVAPLRATRAGLRHVLELGAWPRGSDRQG